jgi:hypothetical protein
MLGIFAAREAGERGSVEQMRAIALCIRQRVRSGWNDASWLAVMESAGDCAAHEPDYDYRLDPNSRTLQMMLREVDDIYFGQQRHGMESVESNETLESSIVEHNIKFWCFLDRPMTEWFKSNIVQDPRNHPNTAHMGLMMFYE